MKKLIAIAVFMSMMFACTGALADAVTVFDGSGNLCESYDTEAASVVYGTDGVVRQYDSEGRLIQVGMGKSGTAGMYYEYGNMVVEISDVPYDTEKVGSVYTLRTIYEYGEDGKLALAVRDVELYDLGDNPYGYRYLLGFCSWGVQPVYDDAGHAYLEWPDGKFEEYADGKLVRSGIVGGYEAVYEYDAEGRLVNEGGIEYVYDDMGRLAGQYYAGEAICTAEYADDGTMILTWTGGMQCVCDSEGRVLEERYTSGSVTRYEYDASGRMISEESISSNGSERMEYNYNGLPTLYVCDTEWDSRRVEYIYAEDGLTLMQYLEYVGDEICIETHYDEQGRMSRVLHDDGSTDIYEYAKDGSVTVECCDSDGNITRSEYYPGGSLKRYYSSDISYTEYDEAGYTVKFVWDDETYYVYEYFYEGDELKAKRSFYDDDGVLMFEKILEGDEVAELYRYSEDEWY